MGRPGYIADPLAQVCIFGTFLHVSRASGHALRKGVAEKAIVVLKLIMLGVFLKPVSVLAMLKVASDRRMFSIVVFPSIICLLWLALGFSDFATRCIGVFGLLLPTSTSTCAPRGYEHALCELFAADAGLQIYLSSVYLAIYLSLSLSLSLYCICIL